MEELNSELQTELEQQIKTKPLWNPKYFLAFSIIFSYLPISLFYIANYNRMREKKLRNKAIIIVLVTTTVFLIGLFFIPFELVSRIFSLSILCGMGYYMKTSQEKLFDEFIDKGGKSANYIFPFVLSLIFILVCIYLLIISANIPDQYIEFLDDEVYYTNKVSVEDVEKLGEFLIEIEWFSKDDSRISVKLDITDNTYKVYFIIKKEYIEDEDLISTFTYLKYELENEIFEGNAVEVYLTDDTFKELKRIVD